MVAPAKTVTEEVPGECRMMKIRKMVEGPKEVTDEIPAAYKTVKVRKMVSPPKIVDEEIPAEYRMIKVRKMVTPPSERRIPIPEEYVTVTKRVKVSDSHLEWRPILCETNTTPDVVRRLQTALNREGYNPGPIDGVLGSSTMNAVQRYQQDKGLPSGQVTIRTLKELNVQQ